MPIAMPPAIPAPAAVPPTAVMDQVQPLLQPIPVHLETTQHASECLTYKMDSDHACVWFGVAGSNLTEKLTHHLVLK